MMFLEIINVNDKEKEDVILKQWKKLQDTHFSNMNFLHQVIKDNLSFIKNTSCRIDLSCQELYDNISFPSPLATIDEQGRSVIEVYVMFPRSFSLPLCYKLLFINGDYQLFCTDNFKLGEPDEQRKQEKRGKC